MLTSTEVSDLAQPSRPVTYLASVASLELADRSCASQATQAGLLSGVVSAVVDRVANAFYTRFSSGAKSCAECARDR